VPAAWSVTSPADLRIFRCWETAGRLTGSSRASSPTALGDRASRSKIARRVGSASAVRAAAWLVMAYGKLSLTNVTVKQVPVYDRRPSLQGNLVTAARLEALDVARIERGIAETSHPLMALVTELAMAAGEHGGWVHWGATTQNITQTGDVLVLREAHRRIVRLLAGVLVAAADLAERTAGMLAAGRTHGQHAVPVTFGFKSAGWIDELVRHVARLRSAGPSGGWNSPDARHPDGTFCRAREQAARIPEFSSARRL